MNKDAPADFVRGSMIRVKEYTKSSAPVMELHPLLQGEGPDQPIAGGCPSLGDGGPHGKSAIILHETIEELVRDGTPVDVVDPSRIEGDWVGS
jgi:hypothetical protein